VSATATGNLFKSPCLILAYGVIEGDFISSRSGGQYVTIVVDERLICEVGKVCTEYFQVFLN